MNESIGVVLSDQYPCRSWSKKSLFSFKENNIHIHLMNGDDLNTIQMVANKISDFKIKKIVFLGKKWNLERCWAFWKGYRLPKFRDNIVWPTLSSCDIKELNNRLKIIDLGSCNAINLPAEKFGPEELSQYAINSILKATKKEKICFSILRGEELIEKKYEGLYFVGKGSSRPPILLTLDFNPTQNDKEPVFACLVGKGVTFDTGGNNIKNTYAMSTMKADMSGAAMLIAALSLSISRGLSKRIRLIVCCADNVISSNSYKPGDIINYRNGISVEVTNTDAEGRLILADGLIDANLSHPKLIIDCATLTGSAQIALGYDYHAIFSFNDNLVKEFMESANEEKESFWRLPLSEIHKKYLSSDFADISNTERSNCGAGASIAAAFLSFFVKNNQTNWIHIDASAAYRKESFLGWSSGATGLGICTIANFLLKESKK